MSFCLSFVIIRAGYLGDYSPPFGGGVWGRGQLVGQALLPFLSFLYRVPTNILWIFFLFSFFLFNFVPIIKEIRTINRMILRTKHLLNWPTQFLLFKLTIVTVPRLFVFCPFVLMWSDRDSCQPASYSLFVGRRWYFLFLALIGIYVFFVLFSFPYLI